MLLACHEIDPIARTLQYRSDAGISAISIIRVNVPSASIHGRVRCFEIESENATMKDCLIVKTFVMPCGEQRAQRQGSWGGSPIWLLSLNQRTKPYLAFQLPP